MLGFGTLPGAINTQARAINDAGQIVGWGPTLPFCCTTRTAFLWDGGPLQPLESLGGDDDIAFGMNNTGLIAGYSMPLEGPPRQAVLWEGEQLAEVFGNGEAYDVNDLRQVVGKIGGSAFFWQDGTLIELGRLADRDCRALAINRNGQIVGHCLTASGDHAVLRTVDF